MSYKVMFYLLVILKGIPQYGHMGIGKDSTVLVSDFVYNISRLDAAKNCFGPSRTTLNTLWSTHFAWNNNTTVYSSHCICILHGIFWLAKWAWAKLNKTVHSTVHMISCLYCTVQLTWGSMASVLSTNHRRCWKMTEMVQLPHFCSYQ